LSNQRLRFIQCAAGPKAFRTCHTLIRQQIDNFKPTVKLPRNGGGGIYDSHPRPGYLPYQRRQERIMRTAQHQRIRTPPQQWQHISLKQYPGFIARQIARFHLLNQSGTRLTQYLDIRAVSRKQLHKIIASQSPTGRQNADNA
jgi:hypothetical protein